MADNDGNGVVHDISLYVGDTAHLPHSWYERNADRATWCDFIGHLMPGSLMQITPTALWVLNGRLCSAREHILTLGLHPAPTHMHACARTHIQHTITAAKATHTRAYRHFSKECSTKHRKFMDFLFTHSFQHNSSTVSKAVITSVLNDSYNGTRAS